MVEDGFIPLSEKPGIGVEINEEGMRKICDGGRFRFLNNINYNQKSHP